MMRPTHQTGHTAALYRRIAVLEAELQAARADPLTGLPARAHWTRLAEAAYPDVAAVLLVDLDGFKAINDTHGHAAGHLILTHAAHRLAANLPAGRVLGRLGGDEFAGITTRPMTDIRDIDRIIAAVTAPLPVPAGPMRLRHRALRGGAATTTGYGGFGGPIMLPVQEIVPRIATFLSRV